MTARDEYDRHLSAWLAAEAPAREPEHLLGEVLARTARTRRRPAWRFAERWIPMSTITSRLAPAAGIPWRPIVVAGLLIIALVVGALFVAGSRRQQLAPPFGAAANGRIAYSVNGDLVAADPKTGTTRTIIQGPESDTRPVFAGNGSKLAFVRGDDGNRQVWVAEADGSNPRKVSGSFASHPGGIDWSPQADVVAVEIDDEAGRIRMARADGSGETLLTTGLTASLNPTFRPPNGDQILIRLEPVLLETEAALLGLKTTRELLLGGGLASRELDADLLRRLTRLGEDAQRLVETDGVALRRVEARAALP